MSESVIEQAARVLRENHGVLVSPVDPGENYPSLRIASPEELAQALADAGLLRQETSDREVRVGALPEDVADAVLSVEHREHSLPTEIGSVIEWSGGVAVLTDSKGDFPWCVKTFENGIEYYSSEELAEILSGKEWKSSVASNE